MIYCIYIYICNNNGIKQEPKSVATCSQVVAPRGPCRSWNAAPSPQIQVKHMRLNGLTNRLKHGFHNIDNVYIYVYITMPSKII